VTIQIQKNRLLADITPEDSGGDLSGHKGILLCQYSSRINLQISIQKI
jgi:hypothetical protein